MCRRLKLVSQTQVSCSYMKCPKTMGLDGKVAPLHSNTNGYVKNLVVIFNLREPTEIIKFTPLLQFQNFEFSKFMQIPNTKVPAIVPKLQSCDEGLRVMYLYSNTPLQVKHSFYGTKSRLLHSDMLFNSFLNVRLVGIEARLL